MIESPGHETPERGWKHGCGEDPSCGSDIVFFGSIDWHGLRKLPSHHVVEILARSHRVLYVDNFGGLRPLAFGDAPRVLRKLTRMIPGRRGGASAARPGVHGSNLVVGQPFAVPLAQLGEFGDAINIRLVRRWLRRIMAQHRIRDPIIWTRVPTPVVWHAIEDIPRRALIYQSVDRFPESPMIPVHHRPRLREYESRFCRAADAVFVSARGLLQEKQRCNGNVHLFPNGVHIEAFRAPGDGVPHGLSRPVIGFAGALGPWVDYPLLANVAARTPQWSYVLLGAANSGVDLAGLDRMPNVHLFGEVAHEALPAWFRSFDVGIIPYRIDHFTEFTFPSKLAEYLAALLPVVATPLPELIGYESVVDSGSEPADIVAAIERAIQRRRSPGFESLCASVAESLSWDRIVGRMDTVIHQLASPSRAP